jgi:hypothetical protein
VRTAFVRVLVAAVGAIVGSNVVRLAAVPEDRARLLARFGYEVERPRRYLNRCVDADPNCVDWYHDNLIPSFWDDMLLYGGVLAVLLYAGYFAASGPSTSLVRAATAGALAGIGYCLIAIVLVLFRESAELSRVMASISIEVSAIVGVTTVVAFLGGLIARRVA